MRVSDPAAPSGLRYFVPLCPALRRAVFSIVGHPRRISPLLAHGHAGAIIQRALCSILRCWNGGRRCLFPLWPTITLVPNSGMHGTSPFRLAGRALRASCCYLRDPRALSRSGVPSPAVDYWRGWWIVLHIPVWDYPLSAPTGRKRAVRVIGSVPRPAHGWLSGRAFGVAKRSPAEAQAWWDEDDHPERPRVSPLPTLTCVNGGAGGATVRWRDRMSPATPRLSWWLRQDRIQFFSQRRRDPAGRPEVRLGPNMRTWLSW